jgi:hypothetical protein
MDSSAVAAASDDDGIYRPDPPTSLKASLEDLGDLESLVGRLGWHEFLFRVGQLLAQHCIRATGERKGALRAVCNHINFIVPGVRWCDQADDAVPTTKVADL